MPLLDQLVAYYKLDGNLLDASGNGRDLEPVDTPVFAEGKLGSALIYDVGGRTPLGGLAANGPVSFSVWVKGVTPFNGIHWAVIIGAFENGIVYTSDLVGSGLRVYVGSVLVRDFQSGELTEGNWSHAVLTCTGTDWAFYLNGVLDSSGSQSPTNLDIGQFLVGDPFVAIPPIDEVGVWSRALTAPEVAELFNADAGLTWPFTSPTLSSSSSSDQTSQSSSSSQSSQPSSIAEGPFTRGIRLLRFAQSRYVANVIDGYRFRVVAYGAYLMPNEIFRYLRRPYNPTTSTEADEFDGVCSPADLEEMPIYGPTGTPPFFRLGEIDLVFRSQAEAKEAWDDIQGEVDVLVKTLNIMDVLTEQEDVEFGDPPPATAPE